MHTHICIGNITPPSPRRSRTRTLTESKQCLAASLGDLPRVRVKPAAEIRQAITQRVHNHRGIGDVIQYVHVHVPLIMFLKYRIPGYFREGKKFVVSLFSDIRG